MTTTIKLPELGENVDSGDLTRILVSAGDTISKDQPLLELETEKATIEVPSPISGVIKQLHVQEGRKVKVGDVLFTVEENGAAAKQKPQGQDQSRAQNSAGKERQAGRAAVKETPSPAAQAAGAAGAQAKEPGAKANLRAKAETKSEPTPAPEEESKPGKNEPQKVEARPAPRAEASAEAGEHLRSCSDCAGKLNEVRKTMALLDEWQAPELSPYFDTRLQARLREEKAKEAVPRGFLAWIRKPALADIRVAHLIILIEYRRVLMAFSS